MKQTSIFDEIVDRRGTESYKWDSNPETADLIPLWVADMDFRAAPCIMQALRKRIEHGVFGYVSPSASYYDALCKWFSEHHGWTMSPDEVIYTSGVVPAVSAVIKAVTHPGDGVILHTPAYNCFYSSIRNNGCQVRQSPLLRSTDGTYTIDFDHLERLASDKRNVALVLCNPHNPTGRVWTREELLRIHAICQRHGVFVISDEIHCELTLPGYTYTPYASICREAALGSAICTSPTKSFNIAGLQIANITVADASVRTRVDRAININEVCDVNPLGVIALQAAYSPDGYEWLCGLRKYIEQNYKMLCEELSTNIPSLRITPLESTYLVWVDCSRTGRSAEQIEQELLKRHGVRINSGTMYDATHGESFIRINIACPKAILEQGVKRIVKYFTDF